MTTSRTVRRSWSVAPLVAMVADLIASRNRTRPAPCTTAVGTTAVGIIAVGTMAFGTEAFTTLAFATVAFAAACAPRTVSSAAAQDAAHGAALGASLGASQGISPGSLSSPGATAAATANGPTEPRPLVIAHRGASGHRPEHTLAGYALAIAMGADYIEPDLVSTKDGVLVARHENEIGGTTDVATKFASRRAVKVVDRDTVRGWFTEDFTLAELKTIRARERLAFRSHAYDGQFSVPTFDEVLTLADTAGKRRGRVVGVYPETKHPSYFRAIGLPLEPSLLATLKTHGLDRRDAPIFIQSFEVGNLRALATQTRVRLVQLVDGKLRPYDFTVSGDTRTFDDLLTPAGLREIATYAFAIGANTRQVIGADSSSTPSPLIANAHAAGLRVHVWTLRPETVFLPKRYGGDPLAEVRELASFGVDGMFGDYPDLLAKALKR